MKTEGDDREREGMPTSLSPHEVRFSGRVVIVWSLVLLIVIAVAIYLILLANKST